MKKYVGLFILIIGMMWSVPVFAASFGMSASTSSISPNGTFTVSIGGDCIGRVDLSVSNGTLSTNSVWVEENYQIVSVTALGSGSVTVTATPTVGFSDADANEFSPGARSVTVVIETPTLPPSNPQVPVNPSIPNRPSVSTSPSVDQKSDNSLLSSLTIGTGSLNPTFDANVEEYTVDLETGVTSIFVQAVSADEKAQVGGIGEITLVPGDNVISVVVTAENGASRTYTIRAYVEEEPNVYLNYKDKKIGIVRNMKGVSVPDGFSWKDVTIHDTLTKVLDNGHFKMVYGVDDHGVKGFYLFDGVKNECSSKIDFVTIDGRALYLVDVDTPKDGFQISTISILDKDVPGYRFEQGFENYFLLSAFNQTGQMVEYLYETSEGTLQLYGGFGLSTQCSKLDGQLRFQNIVIVLMGIGLVLSIGSLFVLFWKFRKGRSCEKV